MPLCSLHTVLKIHHCNCRGILVRAHESAGKQRRCLLRSMVWPIWVYHVSPSLRYIPRAIHTPPARTRMDRGILQQAPNRFGKLPHPAFLKVFVTDPAFQFLMRAETAPAGILSYYQYG